MQPTVGRIVHYKLSVQDVEAINFQRLGISPQGETLPMKGTLMNVGNSVQEGDVLPMIICRIWEPVGGVSAGVNGQVFLDGNDTLWVTSRKEGAEPGTWAWPPRI